jgi:hypothetical protein
MGEEVLNSDDVVGNAFADGLGIACSYDQEDAPILEDALVSGASLALSKLTEAIRKYGNGETIDVPRVSKLAKAAGTCLACTTATPKLGETASKDLGDARLKCVEALFLLLGSAAFRKDEEVALWAGEALADYSDAYSPKDVEWSTEKSVWPEDNNEEFGVALPPHQQVRFMKRQQLPFLKRFGANSVVDFLLYLGYLQAFAESNVRKQPAEKDCKCASTVRDCRTSCKTGECSFFNFKFVLLFHSIIHDAYR